MITLKTKHDIELMNAAGKILKRVMGKLKTAIAANKTTKEIDDYASWLIVKENATAAFLGYKGLIFKTKHLN